LAHYRRARRRAARELQVRLREPPLQVALLEDPAGETDVAVGAQDVVRGIGDRRAGQCGSVLRIRGNRVHLQHVAETEAFEHPDAKADALIAASAAAVSPVLEEPEPEREDVR